MKMLDTNICSYILRRHPISVLSRFAEQNGESLFLSVIVVAELRYGAVKLGSARFIHDVDEWLAGFSIRTWPCAATQQYAFLRAELERHGKPIGGMDMLIAAHALAEGAILVTHNSREFERVPGLTVESWV